MIEMNQAIADNIAAALSRNGQTELELTNAIGITEKVMKRIMAGERTLNAIELQKTAEFLDVSLQELTRLPKEDNAHDLIQKIIDSFDSEAAKEAIKDFDKLMDMIIFHDRVRRNTEKMMKPHKS